MERNVKPFKDYAVFVAIAVHLLFIGLLLLFKVPVDGLWGIVLSVLHVLLGLSLVALRWKWQSQDRNRIALFGYDAWIAIVCFLGLTFNFTSVLSFWCCIIWTLLSAKTNLFYRKTLEDISELEISYTTQDSTDDFGRR